MNQSERRIYLIKHLQDKMRSGYPEYYSRYYPQYTTMNIPSDTDGQKLLLRALMNVRLPGSADAEFVRIQDEYLHEENSRRGVVTLADMTEVQPDLYMWKGDITRLKAGAIVNAVNSQMTGCYRPCHNCIDNCIHTFAGIELRNYCDDMMHKQGYEEPTGRAKLTPAFNLQCDYVIHTVGPVVQGVLTAEDERLLASCYESCLSVADENNVGSIAFCCISTGVFMFPNDRAAEIAVQTVKEYKEKTGSGIKVIFNVFKEEDEQLYRKLLGQG